MFRDKIVTQWNHWLQLHESGEVKSSNAWSLKKLGMNEEPPSFPILTGIEKFDSIVAAWRKEVPMRYYGPTDDDPHTPPAYKTDVDRIDMLPPEAFTNQNAYMAALLHEMAHSTGHYTRFAVLNGLMQDESWKEEMLADWSAIELMEHLGLATEEDEARSARYIGSWLDGAGYERNPLGFLFGDAWEPNGLSKEDNDKRRSEFIQKALPMVDHIVEQILTGKRDHG